MKKVIQFSLFFLAIAWCSGCTNNAHSTVATSQSAGLTSPTIWRDKDGEEVANSLATGSVQVYRWQQGTIQGFIQFDSPDEKKASPIDITAIVDQMVNNLRKSSEDKDEFSTSRITGLLMFSQKQLKDNEIVDPDHSWYQVKFIIKTTYNYRNGDGISFSNQMEGRVKVAKKTVEHNGIIGLSTSSGNSKVHFMKDTGQNNERTVYGKFELVGNTAK